MGFSDDLVPLHRAVCEQEAESVLYTRRFLTRYGEMEGKWFADRAADASEWGRRLYRGEPFRVVETHVPRSVAARFHYEPDHETIGPARYVDAVRLGLLNHHSRNPRIVQ